MRDVDHILSRIVRNSGGARVLMPPPMVQGMYPEDPLFAGKLPRLRKRISYELGNIKSDAAGSIHA